MLTYILSVLTVQVIAWKSVLFVTLHTIRADVLQGCICSCCKLQVPVSPPADWAAKVWVKTYTLRRGEH